MEENLHSTNLPSSIRGCGLHHSIMGADHAHSPIWSLQLVIINQMITPNVVLALKVSEPK